MMNENRLRELQDAQTLCNNAISYVSAMMEQLFDLQAVINDMMTGVVLGEDEQRRVAEQNVVSLEKETERILKKDENKQEEVDDRQTEKKIDEKAIENLPPPPQKKEEKKGLFDKLKGKKNKKNKNKEDTMRELEKELKRLRETM